MGETLPKRIVMPCERACEKAKSARTLAYDMACP